MKNLYFALFFCLSLPLYAAEVTFRIDMNGVSGFGVPEVNGTFNGWCGNCNAMTDQNGDGVWETTVNIPTGFVEFKYSFDNWLGQENLRDAPCGNDANNRTINVQEDTILDVVCWGLCADCLELEQQNWNLVWAEEFLGNSLDMDTWNHDLGDHGWGNNEWQNYTNSPFNLQVSAGSLKIIARHLGGENYTSARITTQGKFEFQYGKVEASIKAPIGQGIWPAFWMLGANFPTIGWPQCGEIDIMEHVNNEHVTHSAVHWNLGGHIYQTSNVPYEQNEFHRYAIIWNEEGITYLLNDHPFFYFPFLEENNTADIFQRPFYFLLNVAVGGNWPGYPDGTATFPATMEVKYIRVFEPSALKAEAGDPTEPFKLYPVPADEMSTMEFESQGRSRWIFVYHSSGKLIQTNRANDTKVDIDVGQWSEGWYFLQVWENGELLGTKKLIKH